MPAVGSDKTPAQRLDKWLWQARFFKSRTISAKQIGAGHVRVNGAKVSKPAFMVSVGDTLTFAQANKIKVVRMLKLGLRRGPATEAQALYHDLSPIEPPTPPAPGHDRKGGRPTKKARRDMGPFRGQPLE